MTRPQPDLKVGAYAVAVRHGRVYLTDLYPGADPGMTIAEAIALSETLAWAARQAEKQKAEQARRLAEVEP
jgi:hypothetical protein